MDEHKRYSSPLTRRYASKEMSYLFSSYYRHFLWRKLWIALAQAQKELGLPITDKQIREMEEQASHIDFERVSFYEKSFKHDVMAHIHAFGEQCPEAKSILHLGATSCFVTDNADLIIFQESLHLLKQKLVTIIRQLEAFCRRYAHQPTLGFTHFQAAQPTTVGKRACSWLQDFISDLHDLEYSLSQLSFLGVKGATGTQASFLSLFSNDETKVKKLDALVAKKFEFDTVTPIATQTYPRKQDVRIFHVLNSIAVTSSKLATDLRLLAHLKEIEEPFGSAQIGSSAMPYKRNPMKSERICALSRFVMSLSSNPSHTAAEQWLERTLDDSANRRLAMSEGFLTTDAILNLVIELTEGLVVYPKVIEERLREELPFLATENILMLAVKKGGDRQHLHEKIRQYTHKVALQRKVTGVTEDLLSYFIKDPSFQLSVKELQELMKPEHFIGRAPHQCLEYLDMHVLPMLQNYASLPSVKSISEV